MFKLRADKLQRNFQITNHKLISFLASTCQQLGPRGLFCDGFLQLVPVERGGLSGLFTLDNDSGAMVSVKYIDLQKREENVLDDREQCSASLAIEVHQTTF